MPGLGLKEAARQVGLHRSTLHRAIKTGRLSATLTEGGDYQVEPVELFRVYPPRSDSSDISDVARQEEDGRAQGEATVLATDATSATSPVVRIAALEGAVSARDREIQVLRETIARL